MKKLSLLLALVLVAVLVIGQPVYAATPAEPAPAEETTEPAETEAVETTETTETIEVTTEVEEQVERENVLFGLDMTTLLIGGLVILGLIALLVSSGRNRNDREVRTTDREVHTTREVIDRDPKTTTTTTRDTRTTNDPNVVRETDPNREVIVEEEVIDPNDPTTRR